MIIKVIFHTYKDNFPLLFFINETSFYPSFEGDARHDLMTDLILELSDLATLPLLAYISRHDKDNKIPQDDLAPFLAKFPEFVACHGKDKQYNIPTVWFVGHFQDYESVAEVKQKLDQKDLQYIDEIEECKSFDQFNQAYWENSRDAEPFVKFLHQATMIGIDLLKTADYKHKLNQLGRLEYMRYTNIEDVRSDITEMEHYLRENSPYYKKHITANASEHKEFWENFTKWKSTKHGTGSWPHFLFNICGISYPFRHPPLKIRTEELFEGWW